MTFSPSPSAWPDSAWHHFKTSVAAIAPGVTACSAVVTHALSGGGVRCGCAMVTIPTNLLEGHLHHPHGDHCDDRPVRGRTALTTRPFARSICVRNHRGQHLATRFTPSSSVSRPLHSLLLARSVIDRFFARRGHLSLLSLRRGSGSGGASSYWSTSTLRGDSDSCHFPAAMSRVAMTG